MTLQRDDVAIDLGRLRHKVLQTAVVGLHECGPCASATVSCVCVSALVSSAELYAADSRSAASSKVRRL